MKKLMRLPLRFPLTLVMFVVWLALGISHLAGYEVPLVGPLRLLFAPGILAFTLLGPLSGLFTGEWWSVVLSVLSVPVGFTPYVLLDYLFRELYQGLRDKVTGQDAPVSIKPVHRRP